LRQLLSQYDKLDAQEQEIHTRRARAIEKDGPESPKLKKFDADLDGVAKDRQKLQAREKELRDLALKAMVPNAAPAPVAPAGEAGTR
jgi:hypothetical protein